jgi:hypothetical protein
MRYLLLRSAINMIDNIMYYELIRFWICKWKTEAPISRRCGVKDSSKKSMRSLLLARRSRRTGLKERRTSAQPFDFKQGPRVLSVWNSRTRDAESPRCPQALMHACMWLCSEAETEAEAGTETETSERQGQRQRPANAILETILLAMGHLNHAVTWILFEIWDLLSVAI